MPLPVLTIAQMRDWEKQTWESGQTEAEVIRRVGEAVARTALRLTRPGDLVLILAGRGNNGADALAAGQHLDGRQVNLLQVADPAADLSRLDAQLSLKPGLIIDGLFGIGLNRPLDPEWVRFIDRLNQSALPVLAVDVPSGLDANSGQPQPVAVRAALTLTVGAPKLRLLRHSATPFVGRLEVASEVGLTGPLPESELQWTLPGDFAGFPPPRVAQTHKGTYGHLLVVAGSAGYHGAAVLAARGAQRAQPGLITLQTLPEVYLPAAAQLQAVMVRAWDAATGLEGHWSAIVAGPGLAASTIPEVFKEQVRQAWVHSPLPMIVDASALEWLPPRPLSSQAARVITPHPGEAARLLGIPTGEVQTDRPGSVRRLSARFGNCWVVLKGHQTLIGRSTGNLWVNSSGNPHLAQGGSGDVLSGYLAGFLAQAALPTVLALRYAVWQHGAAADRLTVSRRNWTVEELLPELGLGATDS